MKEQVAEILGNMAHEVKQCGSKDPALGLAIKQATLEICQLIESKPDYFKVSHEANLRYGMPKSDIKPDEGRLLDENFICQKIKDTRYLKSRVCDAITCSSCEMLTEVVAKAQDAKTASIKEAEFNKNYKEWEEATIKAEKLIIESKDAGCQERVERIFKEIEKHYTATFHGYDNIFLTQGEWEALKKELNEEEIHKSTEEGCLGGFL